MQTVELMGIEFKTHPHMQRVDIGARLHGVIYVSPAMMRRLLDAAEQGSDMLRNVVADLDVIEGDGFAFTIDKLKPLDIQAKEGGE